MGTFRSAGGTAARRPQRGTRPRLRIPGSAEPRSCSAGSPGDWPSRRRRPRPAPLPPPPPPRDRAGTAPGAVLATPPPAKPRSHWSALPAAVTAASGRGFLLAEAPPRRARGGRSFAFLKRPPPRERGGSGAGGDAGAEPPVPESWRGVAVVTHGKVSPPLTASPSPPPQLAVPLPVRPRPPRRDPAGCHRTGAPGVSPPPPSRHRRCQPVPRTR